MLTTQKIWRIGKRELSHISTVEARGGKAEGAEGGTE